MKTLTLIGLTAALTLGVTATASAQRPYGDRDRDGVPNVVDRHNDNGPLGDRDHDGRPNVVDNDRWDPKWGREVRPPRHWGKRAGWNRHVRACFATYRSYNPSNDSYKARGRWVRCTL